MVLEKSSLVKYILKPAIENYISNNITKTKQYSNFNLTNKEIKEIEFVDQTQLENHLDLIHQLT